MEEKRRRSWVIFIGLLIFFIGMFVVSGVGIYNDSDQYIVMHIHREPLYPLFLLLFRWCMGREAGLVAAAIVQNVLTAISIFALTEYIADRFSLKLPGKLIVTGLLVTPHLVTKYASNLGIFLENSIMSEALCIPLLQFFILFLLKMLYEARLRGAFASLFLAFLLSMTRSQMYVALVLWMLGAMFVLFVHKKYKRLILPFCLLICMLGFRYLFVHTYNYFVTGRFIGNTYGQINILTNVIYACDRGDRETFEEGSAEQYFFDRFYEEADRLTANYRYAGENIAERSMHLENNHDILKFQVIEANFTDYYENHGITDYYEQNIMADKTAKVMLTKLLPVCFGRWFYDYLLLCRIGFIRSIAVVNRFFNIIALVIYLSAAVLFCYMCRKDWKNPAVWLMGTAFLFILGNVCIVSLTIMCLSRYMIYGFSLFYIAYFLLVKEAALEMRENRWIKFGKEKYVNEL